jgi:hypothetical protein
LIPRRSKIFFSFSITSMWLQANTASCIIGTEGYFPGIKQQEHEADHSPSSARVKNGGAILPLLYTSSWCGA